jgi:PAS domain S-box-containing protein
MEAPADEVKRLQACINDLISVLALPAIWTGHGPSHVLRTLLDALLGMLRLDFAYARLSEGPGAPPIEVVRSFPARDVASRPQEVGAALAIYLEGGQSAGTARVPDPLGDGEVSIASFPLGLADEAGVLVVGSRRRDFPTKVELLVLRVATNQAGIGLGGARLLDEQRLERKHAEEERRTLAELVERSPDFIGMATPAGRVIFINPAGRRMVGLGAGEDLGSTRMVDCIADDDRERFLTQVVPSLARDERWEGEIHFRDLRTGAAIPMLQNAFVIKEPQADRPRILAMIGRDMTEHRRDEMAVRDARAELAHVARLTTMGELASSLAHELNQPLAAVVTNGSACLRWLDRSEPNIEEAMQAVRRIVRDANRAADVIAHTRALLRKSTAEKTLLNVTEVAREVLALVHPEILRHRVVIRESLAEGLTPVLGDRVQLQQVMLNLVLNGIEAMMDVSDRSRELAIRAEPHRLEDGPGVLVAVEDAGVGLSAENRERVFDAFYTTKSHGLGMGLSISRSIIQGHGGRLWAAANPLHGTTFQFALPGAAGPVA